MAPRLRCDGGISNGLHDLYCQYRQCYTPAEGCVCKFCNSPADHKSHIIHCRWATKDELFELNVSNFNMIVKMLPFMNTTLIQMRIRVCTFIYCT